MVSNDNDEIALLGLVVLISLLFVRSPVFHFLNKAGDCDFKVDAQGLTSYGIDDWSSSHSNGLVDTFLAELGYLISCILVDISLLLP